MPAARGRAPRRGRRVRRAKVVRRLEVPGGPINPGDQRVARGASVKAARVAPQARVTAAPPVRRQAARLATVETLAAAQATAARAAAPGRPALAVPPARQVPLVP